MSKTLLDKPAQWLAGNGADAEIVFGCRGTLARNLADLPFPGRCADDEKRTVEERVLAILESNSTFASGQYYPIADLSVRDTRLLIERNLISHDLVESQGARGVFVADDQSMSVMINERDHMRMGAMTAGFQVPEVWARLSQIDDQFSQGLDYAFDDRHGYLTAAMDEVGTGFRASVFVHLPGLTASGKILGLEKSIREQHHMLEGVFGPVSSAPGHMYAVSNRATLGRSEEEIIYHVRALTTTLLTQERAARDVMLSENENGLLDRVGRALGIAREAHLLEFNEALDLLSWIRLGIAVHRLEGFSIRSVNEILMASQPAHVAQAVGESADAVARSAARADLFRKRFAKEA
ncbi:MAG: hypothetical protein WC655_00800 [Candidatus Hydrogenedentales bacterium]|jgi:protein arginine kinase